MIERVTRSLYEGYLLHVEGLNPVLEQMSERGIPINTKALEAFGLEIDALKDTTYKDLCARYPVELLPAKQKSGYAKPPKVLAAMEDRPGAWDEFERISRTHGGGYLRREFVVTVPVLEFYTQECSCKKGCKRCNKTRILDKSRKTGLTEQRHEIRWYQPLPFKPSKEQIIEYIMSRGHKIPARAVKKGEPGSEKSRTKITTNKVALQTLYRQTGDRFYHLVLLYRNYAKLRSSYVGDTAETAAVKVGKGKKPNRGWQPAADGRVHCSYLFRPASGQLSSVGPNVQNAIGEKGGELGVRFKNCIEARPGHVLCEVDYTGLHAYMLGFLAGDADYMRLSRLGIHDFVTANIAKAEIPRHIGELQEHSRNVQRLDAKVEALETMGLPAKIKDLEELLAEVKHAELWLKLGDKELSEKLGFIKSGFKKLRNKVKPAVHGYGFGLGAFKLYTSYPESFANQKEAQAPLDMLNGLFPKVAQYREDTKELADAGIGQGYLLSPYGCIRYFHHVFNYAPIQPGYELKFGEKLVSRTNNDGVKKLYVRRSGFDAERAIAYMPSNCSFGYKKDAMLSIHHKGLDERFNLINEIHDSLMFEVLEERLRECLAVVPGEMQYHSNLLVSELAPDGLVCYAGASVGKSWGDMKEIH